MFISNIVEFSWRSVVVIERESGIGGQSSIPAKFIMSSFVQIPLVKLCIYSHPRYGLNMVYLHL